jgi:peptidoglycan hydrolase-like protein with peptidoglycan-binding domain
MVTKEKVKEIPLKRPKGVGEDQWAKAKELYKIAKLKGDAFPELTVAQAALETAWFKKPSGKYNYFGQKASKSQKGSIKTTQEQVNDSAYYSQEKFRDYNNLEEAVSDRISKWGEKYKDASTAREALSKIWKYDENKGQGVGYATDTKYGEKIDTILNMIGVPSEQEKSLFVYTQEEQSMGPENPPENIDEKNLTNFAETQESSIFAKPSSSEEEDDEVDEVPAWKLALEKKQQERDVITDYISRGGLDFNAPEYERTVLPQPAQQKFEEGGQIPTNPNGVFAVGKNPVRVPTKDGNITMKGVEYPILGIANTGEEILMQPGGEYHFKGATEVLELPQLQKGGLKKADSKEKPNTQNTGRNTKNPSTLDLYDYNNFLNEEGTTDPAETGIKKATIKKKPTAFDLYNSKIEGKKNVDDNSSEEKESVKEELRTSGPFRQFDVDNLEASSEENKIEPIEKTSEIYSRDNKELITLKKGEKEIEAGSKGSYVEGYQKILKDKGFYKDEIDGKFGKNTKQAVLDYQKEKGLKANGIISGNTLVEMLSEKNVEASPEMKGSVEYFTKTMSDIGYIEKGEEITSEKFESIKREIAKDTQNTFTPAIYKTAAFVGGRDTGNLTEENFSDKELELMRKMAVRGNKLNSSFSYDETREGTSLQGKVLSQYGDNMGEVAKNKESSTISLVLGSAGIIQGPDGNAYVYDTFDFNDVGVYGEEDSRTPDEVFKERMAGAKRRGETEGAKAIAYAIARATGSKQQRKAQIEASEKGEVWKPSVSLINLGKTEDLLEKYGKQGEEATILPEEKEQEKVKKEVQKEKKEVEKKKTESTPKNVQKGAKGSYVEDYQKILKNKGYYKDNLDGIFGKNTKQAVLDFQKERGIKQDGIIGKDTIRELME